MNADRIEGGVREIGGRLEAEYGRLASDDEAQAEGFARQAAGRTQAFYGQAKDGFREAVDRASDYAGDAYDHGRGYMADGGRELNRRVEANPLVAIAMAAAIGYVLGLMVRRR